MSDQFLSDQAQFIPQDGTDELPIAPEMPGVMDVERPRPVPDMNDYLFRTQTPYGSSNYVAPEDPAVVRSEERLAREAMEMQRMYNTTDDRVWSAAYLAQMTGNDFHSVYRNYDQFVNRYFVEPKTPNGIRQFAVASFINTRLDVEIGKIMADALTGTYDREDALRMAVRRENMRLQEGVDPNFFEKIARDVSSLVPYAIQGGVSSAAGALLVGGAATLLAGPAAGAVGAKIGMRLGSAAQMTRVMTGLEYFNLLKEDIPDDIARPLAYGSGLVQGLMEATQLDLIATNPIMKRLYRDGVTRALLKNAGQGRFVKRGLAAAAMHGGNVLGETAIELAQESVSFWTDQVAQEMSEGAKVLMPQDVTQRELEQFKNTLKETAARSIRGFSVLSLPGAVRTYSQVSRAHASGEATVEAIEREAAIRGYNLTADDKADIMDGKVEQVADRISRVAPPRPDDISVVASDSGFSATVNEGVGVAEFDVSVDDGVATINGATFSDIGVGDVAQDQMKAAAAHKIIQTIQENNPDVQIQFDENDEQAQRIKRAIEDQTPEGRALNASIDEINLNIEGIEDTGPQVEELTTEEQEAVSDDAAERAEEVQRLEQERQELEDKKKLLNIFDTRENWAITRGEYAEKRQRAAKYDQNVWSETPTGTWLVNRIQTVTPNVSKAEAEMVVLLMERQARKEGKTVEQYVKDHFVPGLAKPASLLEAEIDMTGKRAAVLFKDARALMVFSEKADVNSWMHELFHEFRRSMTEEDKQILGEWAGQEDYRAERWSRAAEEKVVNGVFARIAEDADHGSAEINSIFDQLRKFLSDWYHTIAKTQILTDDVRGAIDRMLFGEEAGERLAADGTPWALFEKAPPTDSPAFKKWFGDSKVVDENGEPLVVYHGSTHVFDTFSLDGADEFAAMGPGFYFTSSSEDAVANYAGVGPDLSLAIRQTVNHMLADADRLRPEYERLAVKDGVDLSSYSELIDWANTYAKSQFTGETDGVVYPVYLSIKNPVYFRHYGGTKFSPGEIVKLLRAFSEKMEAFGGFDIDVLVTEFPIPRYIEDGGHAADFFSYLSTNSGVIEATTEGGDSVSAQAVINEVLLESGYDGIIVDDASAYFGGMSGVDEETAHYIVFEPQNIKSKFNRGAWDASDTRILYEEEFAGELEQGVSEYQPIRTAILEQHKNEAWAQEELRHRTAIEARREELSSLYDDAKNTESEEDFVANHIFDDDIPEQTLREIYHDANVQDINQGNQMWVDSLTDEELRDIAQASMHPSMPGDEGIIARANKKSWSKSDTKYARTWIKNRATLIRRKYYGEYAQQIEGRADAMDVEQLRRLQNEQLKTIEAGVVDDTTNYGKEETTQDVLDKTDELRGLDKWQRARRSDSTAKEIDNQLKKQQKILEKTDAEMQKFRDRIREVVARLAAANQATKNRAINELLVDIQRQLADGTKTSKIVKAIQKLNLQSEEAAALQSEYKKYKAQQKRNKDARDATKARKRELKQRTDAVKRMQRYAKSKSIKREYRERIAAMVNHIDPEHHRQSTLDDWKKQREYLEAHPEELVHIDKRMLEKISKTPIDDLTNAEIDDMWAQVKAWHAFGRLQWKIEEAHRIEGYRRQIRLNLTALPADFGDEIRDTDPGGKRKKSTMRGLLYQSFTPQTLVDMLDGNKRYRGEHYKFLIGEVNKARDLELRGMEKRKNAVYRKLAKLPMFQGLTEKNFESKVAEYLSQEAGRIGDSIYSIDALISLYAYSQNDLAWAQAVLGGGKDRIESLMRIKSMDEETAVNQVEAEFKALLEKITPEQKKIADILMADFENRYAEVDRVYGAITNDTMGKIEKYFPVVVSGRAFKAHENQIAQQMLTREGLRRASVFRGFTKERLQNIKLAHRRPIELGAFSIWESQIGKQEHFISHAELARKLKAVTNDTDWRTNVRLGMKSGDELLGEIDRYIDRVIDPSSFMEFDAANTFLSNFRRGTAMAYLAANTVTVFKQLPSALLYLGDADPGKLIAAGMEFATNRKKMIDFVREMDPQVKDRVLERAYQDIDAMVQDPKTAKYKKNLGKYGMALIRAADTMAVTVGWKATYDTAIANGLSHEDAVARAQDATLRTQPAGSGKDTPTLYNKESLYLLTQFSNQLNKIWNMMLHGVGTGGKEFRAQKIASVLALGMNAWVMWALSTRQAFPDDPEDVAEIIANQMISTIPIAGSIVNASRRGWSSTPAALTPFVNAGEIAMELKEFAVTGEMSQAEMFKVIDRFLETGAIAAGVPYIAPKRAVQGAYHLARPDSDRALEPVSYLLFGGQWSMTGEEE